MCLFTYMGVSLSLYIYIYVYVYCIYIHCKYFQNKISFVHSFLPRLPPCAADDATGGNFFCLNYSQLLYKRVLWGSNSVCIAHYDAMNDVDNVSKDTAQYSTWERRLKKECREYVNKQQMAHVTLRTHWTMQLSIVLSAPAAVCVVKCAERSWEGSARGKRIEVWRRVIWHYCIANRKMQQNE